MTTDPFVGTAPPYTQCLCANEHVATAIASVHLEAEVCQDPRSLLSRS